AVHPASTNTSAEASTTSIAPSTGELPSAPASFATLSSPTQAVHNKNAAKRIRGWMIDDHIALQLTTICGPLLVQTHTRPGVGGATQSHEWHFDGSGVHVNDVMPASVSARQ